MTFLFSISGVKTVNKEALTLGCNTLDVLWGGDQSFSSFTPNLATLEAGFLFRRKVTENFNFFPKYIDYEQQQAVNFTLLLKQMSFCEKLNL